MITTKIKHLILYENFCYKRDLMYLFKPENTIFRGGDVLFIKEKRESIANYRQNKHILEEYKKSINLNIKQ